MFAVLQEGSKQHLITVGTIMKFEKIEAEVGSEVSFNDVRLVAQDLKNDYCLPDGIVVRGIVLEHKRNPKVIIFKKRRRKNSRRKTGHRQHQTVVKITEIQTI